MLHKQYNDFGGNITLAGKFGQHPLQYHPYLINERSTRFQRDYPLLTMKMVWLILLALVSYAQLFSSESDIYFNDLQLQREGTYY